GNQNLPSATLIAVTAVSGTTPIVSIVDPMDGYDGFSLVVVVTGTVHGALTIAAADDYFEGNDGLNVPNAGHFGDISALAAPQANLAVSGAGSYPVQISPCEFGAIQATFTPTSG